MEYTTYGLCCTSKPSQNHIYVSDYDNNVIRKYDENLNELKQIAPEVELGGAGGLNGPCGVTINNELKQLQVIDQNNNRIVYFSLPDEKYIDEFLLFQEDLHQSVKHVHIVPHDLSANFSFEDHVEVVKKRVELDFRPFGVCTRNERYSSLEMPLKFRIFTNDLLF